MWTYLGSRYVWFPHDNTELWIFLTIVKTVFWRILVDSFCTNKVGKCFTTGLHNYSGVMCVVKL